MCINDSILRISVWYVDNMRLNEHDFRYIEACKMTRHVESEGCITDVGCPPTRF